MTTPRIGIVTSTIREGRFGSTVTEWILQQASDLDNLAFEVMDLRDYPLPLHGDTMESGPMEPHADSVPRWIRTMNEFDGYIFVTAEYNHSIPGVLKNALDYLGDQMHRKPASFVGYGPIGSARAIEQLRLILVEFQMAPLRNAVHIGMEPYIAVSDRKAELFAFSHLQERARTMFDDLVWWTYALRMARAEEATRGTISRRETFAT